MSTKPISKTIPQLLNELAETYPNRPAVVGPGRLWTYCDLRREVMKVARRLHRLDVTAGDKVGILMGNKAEWIASALAIVSLGATMASINTWATPRELEYLLRHSDSKYLIATPTYLKADYAKVLSDFEPLNERFPSLLGILGVGDHLPDNWEPLYLSQVMVDTSADDAISSAFAAVQPDDIAFLLYTSGSTSTPKGVQLQHFGLIENPWNIGQRLHITENDRLWLAVSLFWGLGCENAMMNLLTHGGCIVLQEYFDAEEALRLIQKEKCTVFYGTPNMALALYQNADRERYDLSSLKKGATGGTPEQIRRLIEMGVENICQVYGLTETYGNSHVTDAADTQQRRQESCGKLLPGFVQKIVSHEGMEVGAGKVGELLVKGYVTPAYYKDEASTTKAFDEHGFFRTGDLCLLDADGYLYFKGRIKELVKTGGMNVAPAEVEAVLSGHPAVHLVQVVGVPHESRDEVLAAAVVLKPGAKATADELTLFCKRNLAAYKVPQLMRFIEEVQIPLTTTGKIQKNRIAEVIFGQK